jgi:DNA-binding transcriptional MerR regulator
MAELWRIDELQTLTEEALRTSPPAGATSARVRAVPDARTIRYYTTLGLIDRPAEMRGRVAYYGRRHVLQLVCIKRLQAEGLSLDEVQLKLTGATTRRLNDLAALPDDFWDRPLLRAKRKTPSSPAKESSANETSASEPAARDSFWSSLAMPAAGPATTRSLPDPIPVVRLPIAANVALEISGVDWRQVPAESSAALAAVLQALRRDLCRLGLVAAEPPSTDGSSSSSVSSGDST